MVYKQNTLNDEQIAHETAKILIETKSVLFNTEDPFTYTSGRVGPVYIDCRRLISFPKERSILMDYAAGKIEKACGTDKMDAIAGGETAGIPYAAFISERLELPMLYIRKKAKGFGRMSQIEGHIDEGKTIVLVEDLQNYGVSQKIFIDAIRAANLKINHAFVLFNYGNDEAAKNMKALNVELLSLCNWWQAIEAAKNNNYFDTKTISSVEKFLHDPIQWSIDHGGKGYDEDSKLDENKRATL